MLILERSVTREFWSSTYDYIERRVSTNRFEPVGRTGVTHVFGGDCTRTYAIIVNGHPVAWLYLGRRPQWKAWEVRQVWVFPELRGHGLAARLYRAAINVDGIILAAGKSHTKTSRALWKRFIERETFNIWAQDFNDLNQRSGVTVYDDELYCSLQLYTAYPAKQDVRFVAVRN
jgi:GNAT superfamily N-acetyltransferase